MGEDQMMRTRQPRSSRRPRPPRLRNACNNCNTSKVKCTGESTGCARCVKSGTQCVYQESRVGKNQGSRRRSTAHSVQDEEDATEQTLIESLAPGLGGYNTLHRETEDRSVAWSGDFDDIANSQSITGYRDATDTLQTINAPTSNLDIFDFNHLSLPNMLLPAGSISSNLSNSISQSGPTTCSNSPQGENHRPRVEAQTKRTELQCLRLCILTLTELANYLDLGQQMSNLDILLPIIKRSCGKLEKIIDSLQQHHYFSSMAILGVIVDKIADLLEAAIRSIAADTSVVDLSSDDDDDDQQEIQYIRLQKAINRTCAIARKVEKIAGADCAVAPRERLWIHLEDRLTRLQKECQLQISG